jgi:undecaprenyl-diphosphatase
MWEDVLRAVALGLVQGITEWLPISSTGHMILLEGPLAMDVSAAFASLFRVTVQLGSILAVLILYFSRLDPWAREKDGAARRRCVRLWGMILIACVPAAAAGFLFDDWLDAHLYNAPTVAAALIVYGAAFLLWEWKKKPPRVTAAEDVSVPTALTVGAFQMLALIPGTSRSGATILGAGLCGVSRPAAAEFSFFLAIPVMLGAGGLKLVKLGTALSGREIGLLLAGTGAAFAASMLSIRFLLDFVRRHSFVPFAVYRIVLGIAVLALG